MNGQPLMIICTSSFMCFPMPSQEGGVNIHAVIWYIVLLSRLCSLTNSFLLVTILAQAIMLDSLLRCCVAKSAPVLPAAVVLVVMGFNL